jgi:hypothetical protein
MYCRGGKLQHWTLKPDGDSTWTSADWGRAVTLEGRFSAVGVSEEERRKLIPCAVYLHKFPGTVYDVATMKRLQELLCKI